MNGLVFLTRFVVASVAFFYLVLLWAVVPFRDPELEMNITALSVFFGTNQPVGWVRDLLLLSRAALGMSVVMYIFIPCLQFFFEFRAKAYSNTIALVLVGVSVVSFIVALVVYQVFYL